MSGSASIGLEQAILGHTLAFAPMVAPVQIWVALDLAPPAVSPSESAPGTEVSGGGYTRMPATFALVATPANIAANTTSIEFPYATTAWGTIGYFELWDSPIAGNRLYWGQLIDPSTELTTAVTVSAGDILRFSPGALGVQAATGSGGTSSVGAYLPLGGGQMQGALLLYSDPSGPTQAATKAYVDAHSGGAGGTGFLPLSGGALTGALTLVGDASLPLQPVTLQQVNSASVGGPFLPVTGGVVATGSTASRTLQDRFAAAWNLKDFGAKSDGTTDDSAAITAAITAICALPHGGKLLLPAGRTVVASAIVATIPAAVTIAIEGMGVGASELYCPNATNGLAFTVANTAGVHLRSFTLTRGPTSPAIASTGLSISVVSGDPMYAGISSLRDLLIRGSVRYTNQWQNSVVVAGISGIAVDNVSIFGNNATATDQGDTLLSLSGGQAANQYAATFNISDCNMVGGSAGINVSGWVQGVFIDNSTVIGQYDSIRWTGGGPFLAEEMAVSNSTLGGAHRGFWVQQVNQCAVSNTTILRFNVGVTPGGFAGVELNQSAYASIIGNNIFGALANTETGILLSNGSSCNTIIGNVTGNLNGAGVWCQGTSSVANTIVGNNLTGGTGIVQDTAGNTIVGNTWNGNAVAFTPVSFASLTGDMSVVMNGAAGTNRMFDYSTSGVSRWFVGANATAESGSNAGSDFAIVAASDAGALIQTPLLIARATGIITLEKAPIITILPTNAANDAAAATAGIPVGGIYRNGSVMQVRVS